MTTTLQLDAITTHGNNLLAIFPQATERDPVKLCKQLRRLETKASKIGLRKCNGPQFAEGEAERIGETILNGVNALLGNVNEYQPKTGAKCGCRRGAQRDNCPACEGTGYSVDFHAIRNRKPLVPVFINSDPRGFALKIDDEWMRASKALLHRDMGNYGILAPEIDEQGN